MTKTTEVVVLAYKKENNPNKKVKILAICHLLKNKKTITEVSKILFKAYNTIKNWFSEYEDWKQKKYQAVQRSKTKHFWSLWRQRQRKNSILFLKILRVI